MRGGQTSSFLRLKQSKFLEEHKSVEILWVCNLDVPCNVTQEVSKPHGALVTFALHQALLTTEISSNWTCLLFLAVDCVWVEGEWRVCALHNASDATLDTEAVTMATHICTLSQECFGPKAVETWFLTEAEMAAKTVTWNSSQWCVNSLSMDSKEEIDAPLCRSDIKLQAWEILDNFNALDGVDPTHQQPVVFELADHFSLAPGVDFASLQDARRTKSFTTGLTGTTQNVAAQMAVAVQVASRHTIHNTTSHHTNFTGTTGASSHWGTPQGNPCPGLMTPEGPTPGSQEPTLSTSLDTVQQTQEGEGNVQAPDSVLPGEAH